MTLMIIDDCASDGYEYTQVVGTSQYSHLWIVFITMNTYNSHLCCIALTSLPLL